MRNIVFIGGGNMAQALVGGLVKAGRPGASIIVIEPSEGTRRRLVGQFGVSARSAPGPFLEMAELLVWAVKPQNFEVAAASCAGYVAGALQVSVMAGVRSDAIVAATGSERVIRVMPNTPALVLEGATAIAYAAGLEDGDMDTARQIFEAVGRVVVLDESMMDAVTGLSGSGPAYIALVVEALADGGVRVGLDRKTAMTLAMQTVLGSARLLIETGMHPGQLKDMVSSPGGTTIAGIHTLEIGGLRRTLIDAVERATHRSRELGQGR